MRPDARVRSPRNSNRWPMRVSTGRRYGTMRPNRVKNCWPDASAPLPATLVQRALRHEQRAGDRFAALEPQDDRFLRDADEAGIGQLAFDARRRLPVASGLRQQLDAV